MIEQRHALASVGAVLHGPLGTEGLVEALFHQQLVVDGLTRLRTAYWCTDATAPTIAGAEQLFVTRGKNWHRSVLRLGRALLHVVIGDGSVTVRIAHDAEDEATAALEAARSALPEREPAEDQTVPMWLWSAGGDVGARASRRSLEVSRWDEIRDNYSEPTRNALDRLMQGSPPAGAARLIVWTGEPGTGKTTAIRALAWEWRHRYELHCVIDPEVLLGRSDYLMEVLAHGENAGLFAEESDQERRGLLLVLEDAGELLSRDAKERVGQGLSRLLNIADGLLGWGRDLLVLITTNEPVGRLHSAVVRPGRCVLNTEFRRLSPAEATVWLESRAVDRIPSAAPTLAELYALASGEWRNITERRVGF